MREILERYAALHVALKDDKFSGQGQFELFAISGNGNGSTGTPCLYRRNRSKLRDHMHRTVADLIRTALNNSVPPTPDARIPNLITFFDAFGDHASLEKLEGLRPQAQLTDETRLRIAA